MDVQNGTWTDGTWTSDTHWEAKSNEQQAKSNEQRAKSNEQRAKRFTSFLENLNARATI